MEIPSVSSLGSEVNERIQIAPGDNFAYPEFYKWPFGQIVELAAMIPPTKGGKNAEFEDGGEWRFKNWNEVYQGYDEWAVPEEDEGEGDASMIKMMTSVMNQHRYGIMGGNTLDKPELQLKKMFARPIERQLKQWSKSEQCKALGEKILVLKVALSPYNSSWKEDTYERISDDVKVWRLLTCFGDTKLDSLHDQIIAPAMGWRRHYHAYKFCVPTNGACFGPNNSDAVDMMHASTGCLHFLDAEEYDIRHVLRRSGQRLAYIYDLGDHWTHVIALLGVMDTGSTIDANTFDDERVSDALQQQDSSSWTLTGNHLLCGELNCPPEDSNGCSGMGKYGSLLKKGRTHILTEPAVNWDDHGTKNAYDFNLGAHQRRFSLAVNKRKNPEDGSLQFMHRLSSSPSDDWACRGFLKNANRRKHVKGAMGASEVLGAKSHKPGKTCDKCGKQAGMNSGVSNLLRCARCKSASYCGTLCQRADWKEHKKLCQPDK